MAPTNAIVFVAAADGRSGSGVHAALNDASSAFGAVLFHDGGDDHGGLMVVNDGVHDVTSRDGDEAVASSLLRVRTPTPKDEGVPNWLN